MLIGMKAPRNSARSRYSRARFVLTISDSSKNIGEGLPRARKPPRIMTHPFSPPCHGGRLDPAPSSFVPRAAPPHDEVPGLSSGRLCVLLHAVQQRSVVVRRSSPAGQAPAPTPHFGVHASMRRSLHALGVAMDGCHVRLRGLRIWRCAWWWASLSLVEPEA